MSEPKETTKLPNRLGSPPEGFTVEEQPQRFMPKPATPKCRPGETMPNVRAAPLGTPPPGIEEFLE